MLGAEAFGVANSFDAAIFLKHDLTKIPKKLKI